MRIGDIVTLNLYDLDPDRGDYEDFIRYQGKSGILLEGFNNSLWLVRFDAPVGIRGFFERYFVKPQILLPLLPTNCLSTNLRINEYENRTKNIE